jgi:hypothetical protein
MSLDTSVPRSRRALLGAAVGAAVATVASALGRPVPVRAGTDGDVVLGAVNTSSIVTSIVSPTGDGTVFNALHEDAGTAISGNSKAGTGGWFRSVAGTALYVDGKAKFSRSGRVSIAAGHRYADITPTGGLSGSPLIFATLQTYRSGIYVAAARKNYPSTGTFRIYLNKTVTATTYVAWHVLG